MTHILIVQAYHSFLWQSTHGGDIELVNEAVDAQFNGIGTPWTREDFDQIYHNFGAVMEFPAVVFAPQLISMYPEAKVVLVERDVDSWYKSLNEAVINASYNPFIRFMSKIDKWNIGPMAYTFDKMFWAWMKADSAESMRKSSHDGALSCSDNLAGAGAKEHFEKHNKMIREITPQERLLVFHPSQGWEPLCRHLNKPIPDQPFPHVNETAWLNEKISILAKRRLWLITKGFLQIAAPVLLGVLGWYLWKS